MFQRFGVKNLGSLWLTSSPSVLGRAVTVGSSVLYLRKASGSKGLTPPSPTLQRHLERLAPWLAAKATHPTSTIQYVLFRTSPKLRNPSAFLGFRDPSFHSFLSKKRFHPVALEWKSLTLGFGYPLDDVRSGIPSTLGGLFQPPTLLGFALQSFPPLP